MRIDPSKMTRNAKAVLDQLVISPNSQLIAKANVTIMFPSRFLSKNLASLGAEPSCVGLFLVALDSGEYAVMNWVAKVPLRPSSVMETEHDGVLYQEFEFFKGDVICPNTNLVKSDTLAYYVYEELYSTGKYPWYFTEYDALTMFKTAQETCGVKLAANNATFEMLVAHLTRQIQNRYDFHRHNNPGDMNRKIGDGFDIIALRNVSYGAQDTTSKIMGSYLDEGLTSALISPSDRASALEEIYRKNQR